MLQPSKCWDSRCVPPSHHGSWAQLLPCRIRCHPASDLTLAVVFTVLLIPSPYLGILQQLTCFVHLMLSVLPLMLWFWPPQSRVIHSTAFSLKFVYWAKGLFLFCVFDGGAGLVCFSAFESADFLKRCKFIHRPQCLDLTPLPIGAPACNAHTCLGHCFSAFWLLSKNYSLLVSYLTIQSFSVITNTKLFPILNYCLSMRIATVYMPLFFFSVIKRSHKYSWRDRQLSVLRMHTALTEDPGSVLSTIPGRKFTTACSSSSSSLSDVQVQLHACVNIPAHGYTYIAII